MKRLTILLCITLFNFHSSNGSDIVNRDPYLHISAEFPNTPILLTPREGDSLVKMGVENSLVKMGESRINLPWPTDVSAKALALYKEDQGKTISNKEENTDLVKVSGAETDRFYSKKDDSIDNRGDYEKNYSDTLFEPLYPLTEAGKEFGSKEMHNRYYPLPSEEDVVVNKGIDYVKEIIDNDTNSSSDSKSSSTKSAKSYGASSSSIPSSTKSNKS